jgi:hypothetical protein
MLFPVRRTSDNYGLSSIGFWYAHKQNGFSTESVVVILRHLPRTAEQVTRQVELVADKLAECLANNAHLPALYEFDGVQLVQRRW